VELGQDKPSRERPILCSLNEVYCIRGQLTHKPPSLRPKAPELGVYLIRVFALSGFILSEFHCSRPNSSKPGTRSQIKAKNRSRYAKFQLRRVHLTRSA